MQTHFNNWTDQLQVVLQKLGLDGNAPLVFMPAAGLINAHHPKHAPSQAILLYGIQDAAEFNNLQIVLKKVFPDGHAVNVVGCLRRELLQWKKSS